MSAFGYEMSEFGRDLSRDITAAVQEATASLGAEITGSFVQAAEEKVQKAQQYAEEQHRKARE